MAKKDSILGKNQEVEYYDLNDEEKLQVASLVALMEQARMAQDQLYSMIVRNVSDRYEIVDKDITLNFEEILTNGAKCSKLVVK